MTDPVADPTTRWWPARCDRDGPYVAAVAGEAAVILHRERRREAALCAASLASGGGVDEVLGILGAQHHAPPPDFVAIYRTVDGWHTYSRGHLPVRYVGADVSEQPSTGSMGNVEETVLGLSAGVWAGATDPPTTGTAGTVAAATDLLSGGVFGIEWICTPGAPERAVTPVSPAVPSAAIGNPVAALAQMVERLRADVPGTMGGNASTTNEPPGPARETATDSEATLSPEQDAPVTTQCTPPAAPAASRSGRIDRIPDFGGQPAAAHPAPTPRHFLPALVPPAVAPPSPDVPWSDPHGPQHDPGRPPFDDLDSPTRVVAATPASSDALPPTLALVCSNRHANPPGVGSCRRCDQSLRGVPLTPVAAPVFVLEVSDVGDVPVDRPLLFGRNPRAERVSGTDLPRLVALRDDNREVSGTHLEIRPDGWTLQVRDMSTNGTQVSVDGKALQRLGSAAITVGPEATLVLAGAVTITVRWPAA